MTRAEKDAVISDLREKIESANALFLTNMIGIEANQAVDIRKRVRESKGTVVVTRNTLFGKASEGTYAEELLKNLKGTNAVAFAFEDAPGVAKAIYEASKELEQVTIQDGYLKQKLLPSSKSAKQINVTLQTELQARLAENPKNFKNSLGMTMQLFHPNDFRMGAPRGEKGQRANEFQRSIRLSKPIYVSIHEVTVEQFSKFRPVKPVPSNASFPITNVSWNDAVQFCNWLSQKDKLKPFYRLSGGRYTGENREAEGYRLPTEAEWEWLARKAGRQKTSRFTWGDEYIVPPSSGNFADESARGIVDLYIPRYNDGHPRLASVGSFGPDKAGLFDISGNVSEWVHDLYSLFPPKPGQVEIDPFGPNYGDSRVVKGSNWRSGSLTELRAAFRDGVKGGRVDVGFRVVRYLYGKNDATK